MSHVSKSFNYHDSNIWRTGKRNGEITLAFSYFFLSKFYLSKKQNRSLNFKTKENQRDDCISLLNH